jgi:hypothetical protein
MSMFTGWSRLEERFVSTEMDIETEGLAAIPGQVGTVDHDGLERRGRRWLIWSFIFCPCHLPISMAVLAAIFGGSAFGTLIGRNTLGVGLILGAIYAVGVGIGFRHLRAAAAGKDCSGGACEVPPLPSS